MNYYTFTRDGERHGVDVSELPCSPVEAWPMPGDVQAEIARLAADDDLAGEAWAAEPAEPVTLEPAAFEGPALTVPQYHAALALAAAHGHAWGYACLTGEPAGDRERHRAARREILARVYRHNGQTTDERADDGPIMIPLALITQAALAAETGQRWGLYEPEVVRRESPYPDGRAEAVVEHTTQSGRVTWAVRPNGDATVKVWRPHPLVGPIRRALENYGHFSAWEGESPEPFPSDVATALAAARPAAELVEGAALDDREVLRWLLAALEGREPVCVLEADCRADGRCWVTAPEGAPPFGVRHVLALEECLEALRAWPAGGNDEMRTLFERCPDVREFVEGVREAFERNANDFDYDYACRKWHWLAGPVPTRQAA